MSSWQPGHRRFSGRAALRITLNLAPGPVAGRRPGRLRWMGHSTGGLPKQHGTSSGQRGNHLRPEEDFSSGLMSSFMCLRQQCTALLDLRQTSAPGCLGLLLHAAYLLARLLSSSSVQGQH